MHNASYGVLPTPHNDIDLDMLFSLAEFHAFAKMCIHTDRTLKLFDESIIKLGSAMCKFKTVTCAMKELPCKSAAQGHHETVAAAKANGKKPAGQEPTKSKDKGEHMVALSKPAPGLAAAMWLIKFD